MCERTGMTFLYYCRALLHQTRLWIIELFFFQEYPIQFELFTLIISVF